VGVLNFFFLERYRASKLDLQPPDQRHSIQFPISIMAEELLNYTDYISRTFSDDVDENSATLPRRNGRTNSLSSVELSSLFEPLPREKRLDINNDASDRDDDTSSPSKMSEQIPLALNEKSKLLSEDMRQKKTPPPPGRKKRGLSPAQAKRKVFSPGGVALSSSEFSMMGTITEEGSDDEEEDIVS
jgi:hypothetical protein